jgi:2-oxoisovalerate dehydrogenase E2 component (dihydrolipoyl transacylase)
MGVQEFRLPDVGEGLTEAEIVAWHVAPGDTVKVNDPIVDIETAKSVVELPCPFAGVVERLLVEAGETVPVGTPIITVTVGAERGLPDVHDHGRAEGESVDGPDAETVRDHARYGGAGQPERRDHARPVGADQPEDDAAEPARREVLVGYGPRGGTGIHSRRRPPAPRPAPSAPAPSRPEPVGSRPLATPPVRKLAKDRGVDLREVTPTGAGGVVTRADVEAFTAAPAPAPAPRQAPAAGRDDVRVPVRGVRKATAEAMVASAFTAPHVTLWLTVDVTRSVKLLRRLKADPELAGLSVSPLLLAARAVVLALRRHPALNARWDGAAGEIVQLGAVHLGIAVATPRGLLVPSLKDADRLTSLADLARGLTTLAGTAREGRATPRDLSGGTFTITNVGVFGVDGGTPILNPGEAGILGLGQVRERPWVHRGAVRPRWVTELTLSIDHRVVDGEQGGRFLADVGAVLERPERLLTWG